MVGSPAMATELHIPVLLTQLFNARAIQPYQRTQASSRAQVISHLDGLQSLRGQRDVPARACSGERRAQSVRAITYFSVHCFL